MISRRSIVLTLAAALAGGSLPALAASRANPIKMFDTDNDGTLDLAEVKTALVDPSQKEVPILTIALDAGFGSLGPFNRAFREAEGMTPSEFRAAGAG